MEGIILSERNSTRSGCKDVFHAFLVKNATYDGDLEIPCLAREIQKPIKLVAFSKAIASKEVDSWIHYKEKGIGVLQFDSEFMKSRKAVSA